MVIEKRTKELIIQQTGQKLGFSETDIFRRVVSGTELSS